MGVKLEKIILPPESEIDALAPEALCELAKQWRQRLEIYQGLLFRARRQIFGEKSEKSDKTKPSAEASDPAQPAPAKRSDTTKLPSDRYPDAPVHIEKIDFPNEKACQACGSTMQDSGMTEDSEYLDVDAKEFIVVRQKRHKHRCTKCHGSLVTAPAKPRIIPGGSYSDELIVDASLSKFCDLIPMERYCQMAARSGLPGLPPHSLIQASFKLASFLAGTYELIKQETLDAEVLLADETPHRMLEGDAKKRWFLWGFSSTAACFFECHDTRSGDISTEVLKASKCQVLVTDVYAGYKKSVRETNEIRAKEGLPLIQTAYCNAHARREFIAEERANDGAISQDAKIMVDHYKLIYKLEAEAKELSAQDRLVKRAEMKPIFEAMRNEAQAKIDTYSSKSQMGSAYGYFLKNYDGLTLFLTNAKVPIDNNAAERLLRSHVVGRKTWYGTHSKEGARTAAVHFSIVESCKLNGINPRQYYLDMVNRIHCNREIATPRKYKEELRANTC